MRHRQRLRQHGPPAPLLLLLLLLVLLVLLLKSELLLVCLLLRGAQVRLRQRGHAGPVAHRLMLLLLRLLLLRECAVAAAVAHEREPRPTASRRTGRGRLAKHSPPAAAAADGHVRRRRAAVRRVVRVRGGILPRSAGAGEPVRSVLARVARLRRRRRHHKRRERRVDRRSVVMTSAGPVVGPAARLPGAGGRTATAAVIQLSARAVSTENMIVAVVVAVVDVRALAANSRDVEHRRQRLTRSAPL